MTADVLATCVAGSSTAVVLTVQGKQVLSFQKARNLSIEQWYLCVSSKEFSMSLRHWSFLFVTSRRFRVKTEMIRPEKLDAGTTIKGLDYIDVPGNSKRDYKLTFYAHKEGTSQLKVGILQRKFGASCNIKRIFCRVLWGDCVFDAQGVFQYYLSIWIWWN